MTAEHVNRLVALRLRNLVAAVDERIPRSLWVQDALADLANDLCSAVTRVNVPSGADVATDGTSSDPSSAGGTFTGVTPDDPRWPARLKAKIAFPADLDGCWTWTAARSPGGYGRVRIARRDYQAHRVVWELWCGPIPEGLHLDHLCRVRHCVNPKHLEPVTPRENLLRGENHAAARAAQTHCKHGHEFTEANTYVRADGTRDCRACRAERMRAQRQREKDAGVSGGTHSFCYENCSIPPGVTLTGWRHGEGRAA